MDVPPADRSAADEIPPEPGTAPPDGTPPPSGSVPLGGAVPSGGTPSSGGAAPGTIVRRLPWRPVAPLVGAMAGGGALCATFGASLGGGTGIALGCGAVILLAGAAFFLLATARAYTEIGPDGVRNRALRKEIFVPWADVRDVTGHETAPRVIRLVRRGDRPVTLAGVRDGDASPDGLTFDDVVAVVQDRAHVDPDAPEPEDETVPARPLALRPSRRPLVWAVPVLVLAGYVEVQIFGEFRVFLLNNALIVALVFLTAMVLRLLRGRTDADAGGLQNRLVWKTRRIAWSEIDGVTVTPTLFGRVVTVRGHAVKRTLLAAPREGLLARDPAFDETLRTMRALAAPRNLRVTDNVHRSARVVYWVMIAVFLGAGVFVWRPWLETWWPGRAEASEIPRACAIADPASVRLLLPAAPRPKSDGRDWTYSATSECLYRDADGRTLSVELDLERRSGSISATDRVRDSYARTQQFEADSARLYAARPNDWTVTTGDVAGLGDEAWRSVLVDRRDGGAAVRLVVRRANVLIQVRFDANRPADLTTSVATTLARSAIGRIEIR